MLVDQRTIDRFFYRIDFTNTCWIWLGCKSGGDYSQFNHKINGKWTKTLVHRFSYELFRGKIPDGFQLDHLCRNTRCVKPNHLELVTNRENTIRSTASSLNANKTSEYTGVSWVKRRHNWQSHIRIARQDYHLGTFEDEYEAALVYDIVKLFVEDEASNLGFK